MFAALPDDATTIVLQRAVNPERRTFLASSKGLFLQIPNDIFNGNQRTYYTEEGKIVLPGFGSSEELFDLRSSWLNVEDKLSVLGCMVQILFPFTDQAEGRSASNPIGTVQDAIIPQQGASFLLMKSAFPGKWIFMS